MHFYFERIKKVPFLEKNYNIAPKILKDLLFRGTIVSKHKTRQTDLTNSYSLSAKHLCVGRSLYNLMGDQVAEYGRCLLRSLLSSHTISF